MFLSDIEVADCYGTSGRGLDRTFKVSTVFALILIACIDIFLERFIKDHFSDLFRVLPETPPRPGSNSKERWISAASLRNGGTEDGNSSGSPDSITRNVPSFAISTPDGSQKSGSPRSSPLTPIQFIRRADTSASEISLSSIALSYDLSNSGITSASSIHPRRRLSSISQKVSWKP